MANKGDDRGTTWPLALLFVLTLYGAATALIFPGLMSPDVTGQIPDKWVGMWMLLAAVAAGLALYFPRYWAWKNGPDFNSIAADVIALKSAVKSVQDTLDQFKKDATTKNGTLGTNVDTVAIQVSAGGDVLNRLADLQKTADAIKVKTGA